MASLTFFHVASGTYRVEPASPIVLEAYLGTCVGVTAYDPVSKVGGVSHLLLPEPLTAGSTFQAEKYASVGLPLFIKELLSKGAVASRIEAMVAGGGLIGPICREDMALDIGGRTAEVAKAILSQAGITIQRSETGGLYSGRLSLNLENGRTAYEPVGSERISSRTVDEDIVPASKDHIRRTARKIKPIPQVALKLLRIADEDTYDINSLAAEVRKDQVLSARTLRLCNSAELARSRRIDSLDFALIMLGRDKFIKFVVAAALNDFFAQIEQGYSLCKGGLYHHAIGTAIITEALAQHTQTTSPALAYTAGLLHDIGKVVLDQHLATAYPLFYRSYNDQDSSILRAELAHFGVTHTQLGGELAENWRFHDSLVNVIKHHHAPETAAPQDQLTHLVFLADLLMARFHTGLELERLDAKRLESRLAVLGLSLSQLAELIDLIPQAVFISLPELAIGNMNTNETNAP